MRLTNTLRDAAVLALALPALLGLGPAARAGEETPLIPRQVLFGNPDRTGVRLSPDGTAISWVAPLDVATGASPAPGVEGVMNVWVAPAGDPAAARPVTRDSSRGVRRYFWAFDNRHLVYVQDRNGDENFHAYALDLVTMAVRDLTPLDGVQARIEEVSPDVPGAILVGLNDRDPRLHDLWRIELATGERTLVQRNEGFVGFGTDSKFRVRYAARARPDGGMTYMKPTEGGALEPFLEVGHEDVAGTAPLGFDRAGETMYLRDSRDRDTSALFAVDLASGRSTLLAEDPRADVGGTMTHPATGRVQAVSFEWDVTRWKVLDAEVQADLDALAKVDHGEVVVADRTLDDATWIVAFQHEDAPVQYHRWDRARKAATFLFTNQRDLEGRPLARMHPVVVKSRDGLDLVSYLTLPVGTDPDGDGRPSEPLPLVLDVHGGPWARDSWGYNPVHQWLANRGYAVLSVNFRGSTGFGKRFLNAANGEWAGKMHDDLLDAVEWAVAAGVADRARVAIQGGSYGGYATLVGLTFTPDVFACGIDIVGPSSLLTLLQSVPPYWKPMLETMARRVADPRTEEGRRHLQERSPLSRVGEIRRPLLIGQGANDPRVKRAEADQIVAAMRQKGIPVTYVLYPDEGHGFGRPANRMSFQAIAENFLAPILGGRAEPIAADLAGSSLEVPAGAELVPGLAEALKAR